MDPYSHKVPDPLTVSAPSAWCLSAQFSWDESFDLVLGTHNFYLCVGRCNWETGSEKQVCLSRVLGSTSLSSHCVLYSWLGPELPHTASSWLLSLPGFFLLGVCVIGLCWGLNGKCLSQAQAFECLVSRDALFRNFWDFFMRWDHHRGNGSLGGKSWRFCSQAGHPDHVLLSGSSSHEKAKYPYCTFLPPRTACVMPCPSRWTVSRVNPPPPLRCFRYLLRAMRELIQPELANSTTVSTDPIHPPLSYVGHKLPPLSS